MWETAVHLAVAGGVFDGVFLCCPFSHYMSCEILDLIGSLSGGFLIYSWLLIQSKLTTLLTYLIPRR